IALFPEPLARTMWLLVSDAALLGGLALLWPRRLSISTQIVVGFVTVLNPGFVMSLTWGNLGAWSVLGIGLFWLGYTRGRTALMVVGLSLATMKLVPVFGLALLFVRRVPNRAPTLLGFMLVIGLLTLLAIAATGATVLRDFVLVPPDVQQVRQA